MHIHFYTHSVTHLHMISCNMSTFSQHPAASNTPVHLHTPHSDTTTPVHNLYTLYSHNHPHAHHSQHPAEYLCTCCSHIHTSYIWTHPHPHSCIHIHTHTSIHSHIPGVLGRFCQVSLKNKRDPGIFPLTFPMPRMLELEGTLQRIGSTCFTYRW